MSERKNIQDVWDDFAAAALSGLIAEPPETTSSRRAAGQSLTSRAAQLADQMMLEREMRIKARAQEFRAQVGGALKP